MNFNKIPVIQTWGKLFEGRFLKNLKFSEKKIEKDNLFNKNMPSPIPQVSMIKKNIFYIFSIFLNYIF